MNRKERRAAASGAKGKAPASFVDRLRALGDVEVQAGRLLQAEDFYRQALSANSNDIVILHRLGVVAHRMGRLDEATAVLARALSLRPDFAEAHLELGNIWLGQGRAADAVASYRGALKAQPNYVNALVNLGEALYADGKPDDAIAAWQRAQILAPQHPLPAMNLGIALIQRGQYADAIVQFRRASDLDPGSAEALTNLARAQVIGGAILDALQSIWKALALRETPDAKAVFASCLQRFRFAADMPELRGAVARAITEAWARPDEISGSAIDLVKKSPALAACVARATAAWPARPAGDTLWTDAQRTAIGSDPLLRALLESAPVCDVELERFLTAARRELLRQPLASADDSPSLEFWCALARQCFINEYVYALDADEADKAQRLRGVVATAIGSGADLPALALVMAAAYGPLHRLEGAPSLLARPWPAAVQAVLVQQIVEPDEEARLRHDIPALTAIDDAISLAVQAQYEENPYPRWAKTPAATLPQTLAQTFRTLFPALATRFVDRSGGCDVLVAGCGTGQQSIEVARRYQGARVLAVDLSLSSLSYALRKTRVLAITNITYAQADILKLGGIGRTFDVIESGGVLHHLGDPFAGWRVLLSLLRPGGYMYVVPRVIRTEGTAF